MQELPAIDTFKWVDNELVDAKIKPMSFQVEGRLHVSGEDGLGFIDYYGEFRGGYPYIHPVLIDWAKAQNSYWEWENPGTIVLVAN